MLFTEKGDVVAAKIEVAGWIGKLLASPGLAEQREVLGRQALDDQELATFLSIIDHGDNVAPAASLADAVNLTPSKLQAKLESLRRMLNVDGYQVLTIGADGTARLDRQLLTSHFHIEL